MEAEETGGTVEAFAAALERNALNEPVETVQEETEQQEQPAATQEAAAEETPAAEEPAKAETAEEEEASKSLMAELGIEGWDREKLEGLAKELGPRFMDEIQGLRKENREIRANLQTEIEKRKPFERAPVKDNPYAGVSDLAELQKAAENAEGAIRLAQETLEDHEDAAADEVILKLDNGEELTKRELRKRKREAEDARNHFIPDRLETLQKAEQAEAVRKANRPDVDKAHPWMKEEGNDLREIYEGIAPPIIDTVREKVPKLYPLIDMVLADHAYMSQLRARGEQPQAKPATKKAPIKPSSSNPPASPGGAAAPSGRPQAQREQRSKAALEQFSSSRSERDFAKFLEASSK